MVGLFGCAVGFVVSSFEDLYGSVKLGYKPFASNIIIYYILKNPTISFFLKQALVSNVFYNPDIQFQVHELLMHRAILPQKQSIKELINYGLELLTRKEMS